VARAAHNGREDGARGVVTGETGLAHAGAVVYHEGLNFIIICCRHSFCRGGTKDDMEFYFAPVNLNYRQPKTVVRKG
jgi:hypothetical protein